MERKMNNRIKDYVKKNQNKIKEVSIELTHSCNMNCDFCFNEYSEFNSKKFIDFEKLKTTLISLKKQWLYKIRFTWWEPLLHPKIYNILAFTKRLWFFIKLNTNWILINNKNIKIIEKYVSSILFSYHFPRDNSNKINILKERAIFLISKSKIKYKTISTRINKHVIAKIYDICFHFDKYKFNDLILWFPLKSKQEENIIISEKDYSYLISNLLIYKKIFNIEILLWLPPAYCFENKPNLIKKLTWDYLLGSDKIIITPEFNTSIIYYYFPNKNTFPYWSLNFKEIIESKFIKKFNSFDWLDSKCKECDYLIWCFGWNRINSWFENWNFFWKDPWMK